MQHAPAHRAGRCGAVSCQQSADYALATAVSVYSNLQVRHSKSNSHLRHGRNTVVSSPCSTLPDAGASRRHWPRPPSPASPPCQSPSAARSPTPTPSLRHPPRPRPRAAAPAAGRSQRARRRRRWPTRTRPPPDPNAPPAAAAGARPRRQRRRRLQLRRSGGLEGLRQHPALLRPGAADEDPRSGSAAAVGHQRAARPPRPEAVRRVPRRDNAKAATRLASDMGEFFMPFAGTRQDQAAGPLDAAGMPGAFSSYEVKFTDTTKPNGQIWAGVVGQADPATPASADPAALVRGVARLGRTTPWTRPPPPRWRSRSGRSRRRPAASAATAGPGRPAGSQRAARARSWRPRRHRCPGAGDECAAGDAAGGLSRGR